MQMKKKMIQVSLDKFEVVEKVAFHFESDCEKSIDSASCCTANEEKIFKM